MWRILNLIGRDHLKNQVETTLSRNDRQLTFVSTVDELVVKLENETFHMLIVDDEILEVGFGQMEDALRRQQDRVLPVILLTNYRKGHTRFVLEGFRHWTFVKKPLNRKILHNIVGTLLTQVKTPNLVNYLRHKEKYIYRFSGIIAASPGMKSVMGLVQKVAGSNSSILITGEPGTGKEMIAAVIHYNSPRKQENFVAVECGRLDEPTLEQELFGWEKGANQWADRQRIGRIEQANAGTLLLEQMDSLPMPTQAKILRVIQHKEFERLGGTQKVKVDVRMICTSSQDIKQSISEGNFREDLYYRINVIQIHVPPLRERMEDIPALAQFFLHKYRGDFNRPEANFSPKTIGKMMAYNWPGNVRELENVVERALMLTESQTIGPDDILLSEEQAQERPPSTGVLQTTLNLDQIEKSAIMEALERAKGVQKDAARLLGISPRVIHYKIKKHNITS